MTKFNNTLTVLTFIDPNTGMNGVILPQSSRLLSESDIDSKIKKIKSHIDHLFNAQSHRKTHGGKRFCARQISLQDQTQNARQRLTLLMSAKDMFQKAHRLDKKIPLMAKEFKQPREVMAKGAMAAAPAAAFPAAAAAGTVVASAGAAAAGAGALGAAVALSDGSRPAAAASAQIASAAASREALAYLEIKSRFANIIKDYKVECLSDAIRLFANTLDDNHTLSELEQILIEAKAKKETPFKTNFKVPSLREGWACSMDAFLDVTDFISCVIEKKKSRPLPYVEIVSRFANAKALFELEDLGSLIDKTHSSSSLQQLKKETEAHRQSAPKKNFKVEEPHDEGTKTVELHIDVAVLIQGIIDRRESATKNADAEVTVTSTFKKVLSYSEIAFLFSTAVTLSDLDNLERIIIAQCTSYEIEQLLKEAEANKETAPKKNYKIKEQIPGGFDLTTVNYGVDLIDIISKASSIKKLLSMNNPLEAAGEALSDGSKPAAAAQLQSASAAAAHKKVFSYSEVESLFAKITTLNELSNLMRTVGNACTLSELAQFLKETQGKENHKRSFNIDETHPYDQSPLRPTLDLSIVEFIDGLILLKITKAQSVKI